MTSTISSSPSDAVRRKCHRRGGSNRNIEEPHVERPARARSRSPRLCTLDRYVDSRGRRREVIARPGFAGSVLVLDRDITTSTDRRLVAHLCADEPAENAAVVCDSYMSQVRQRACHCRQVTSEDFATPPFRDALDELVCDEPTGGEAESHDRLGRSYRLMRVDADMSIPELRWRRLGGGQTTTVSVREAIGGLEAYEPVRTLTSRALALHDHDAGVSTAVLRVELVRLLESPIVLNRGLREVVTRAIEREDLSMSEIAIRCGRIKYDRAGNPSGETSWLARRLGILPEGGRDLPTPWIHSDVLALITRQGLGISPLEAELG